VFVDFPETLRAGREYTVDFHYDGVPLETGRFGGIAFRKDPVGRHWINTACESRVAVPNDLTAVSNGRFIGKTDLGDGYTRWDWRINYPINSYNVSLNIGRYVHFADTLGDLTLDYYVLPGEFEPGASPGRHTHTGEEVGYVIEGMITVQQDGKPDVMKHPGEAFLIPAGAIHNAMNSGSGKARLVLTYIVEKGKPLATPAK
jgi:mannose-6-phosphate isomerase-like protein (cupin superfamily)